LKLRIDRLYFKAFSTEMPPSVRGSGNLMALEASCFELPLSSDAAITTVESNANPKTETSPNLLIIPPEINDSYYNLKYIGGFQMPTFWALGVLSANYGGRGEL
jgi:hypothetical protein